VDLRIAGTVNAPGGPLLVMDVAAAQQLTGRLGALSRIDLRLQPGASPEALLVTGGEIKERGEAR
jgi:putative ABC transport system permease protein